jgi:hypothetical protein
VKHVDNPENLSHNIYMKANDYFYVACQAGLSANEKYRDYFRLYKNNPDGKPRLVDQGLAEKIKGWRKTYSAELNLTNPYPELD